MNRKIFIIFILIAITFSHAYLPGLDRKRYKPNDVIEVKTRKLASKRNLPFDFYSLPFCKPKPLKSVAENLGEVLFGDRIENSLYILQVQKRVTCKLVKDYVDPHCESQQNCVQADCPKISKDDIEAFKRKIDDEYEAQMIVDGLPVANLQDLSRCGDLPDPNEKLDPNAKYTRPDGFPIGCAETKDSFIVNNHLTFRIKYHVDSQGTIGIVGAAAIPSSIAHTEDSCSDGKEIPRHLPKLRLTDGLTSIPWSYSVEWELSPIRWSFRWDAYLNTGDREEYKIHWFSIVNSLLIVLFLTGMVAMIMLRALNKDIAIYNAEDDDEPTDETGWKLVHGDVFRPPYASTLFCVSAGSGVQVFGMAIFAIIFASLGFLSPAYRGGLMTTMLVLFVLMGSFAGYFGLRLYKMFEGEKWKTTALLIALIFPGIVFVFYIGLNLIVVIFGSSSTIAVPFSTLLSIVGLWFGVSTPLVFLGAYFGFKKEPYKLPVKVLKIPREIPNQPWYMRPPFSVLMGGILPFGAVFIELYFIMSSIWLHKLYYVFGFLLIVFIILILTCAEITIVMIYFQLCNGDYRWWWRSFFTSGSSALYLLLYSVFYFVTKLRAVSHFLMGVVFFGYMAIISYFFFVLTGAIGFYSAFWFIVKIFGSIKVD